MTKATETGPMAGKSKAKVARTEATEKAVARKRASKPVDPVQLATTIHNSLLSHAPKLDKVGARLEKALKAIMDGGDAANLSALATQVDDHIKNGVPAVMKSTSRGGGAVKLSDTDKAQVAEEASNRKAGTISHVKSSSDGNYIAVGQHGGDSFVLPKVLDSKEFSALARIGQPYAPAKKLADELIAARPAARLANGIDARNSPQSVAAHQAGKGKASKAAEKPAPASKADPKKEARKTERAEKAAPKGDDKRAITILKKDFAFGRDGSARRASWDKVLKAKTVQAYIAAGGAPKYLPRWQSAGAIKMG